MKDFLKSEAMASLLGDLDVPLITRYASPEMVGIFTPQNRHGTWRRLWLALAEAEAELGLLADDGKSARIKPSQLEALKKHLDDIDFAAVAKHEKRLRHDVMAHLHALGDVCPGVSDILHLGATSCYVTDNAELILMRDGLALLEGKLASAIHALGGFARRHREMATLGFTHFQPAPVDPGPADRPGGDLAPAGHAAVPRGEGDHGDAGELFVVVPWRPCQGAGAGQAGGQKDGV